MSAAAARQTLRNFAAWANKIDANKAAHTPIVIGAVGVSCIGSYAIQAAVSKDNSSKFAVKQELAAYGVGTLEG